MPKSNHTKNAYFFFMLDWKRQEENKGHHFPNGLKDVQSDWRCNNTWKHLSYEEKAHYKEKEIANRNQLNSGKKTCTGESVSQQLLQADKEQKEFVYTRQYILSLIYNTKANKTLQKLKFCVIHINYFYGRILDGNEIYYCPAEVAIAEFCLQEGITRTYHKIFKSKIQMGYAYEALEHSKHTHQIPKDTEFGEENHSLIYKEICEFLNSNRCDGKLPILFTREVENVKHPVINVLKTLSNCNKTLYEDFTIYSFEELFAILYNAISEEKNNEIKFDSAIASLKLNNDPYDYKKNIQCDFHKETVGGGIHCSKSFVQRWILVLLSYTFDLLGIDLQPAFHRSMEDEYGKQSLKLYNSFANLTLDTSQTTAEKIFRKDEKQSSEKTYKEEKRYRKQLMAKPLIIIDHSINEGSQNLSNVSKEEAEGLLHSMPHSFDNTVINLNAALPSLGRGSRGRGRSFPLHIKSIDNTSNDDEFPSMGRGCRIGQRGYPVKSKPFS